jgi:nucleoside-diphosphate-sugar epimerase
MRRRAVVGLIDRGDGIAKSCRAAFEVVLECGNGVTMRVLVVGATGFVGGHAAQGFAARGDDVVGLVRSIRRAYSDARLDRVRLVEGSVAPLPPALAGESFDLVFYAAGAWRAEERLVAEEVERRCREVYVEGVENVAALAARSRAHVVFMSGITRFGRRAWQEAVTEDSPPGPLCVYGRHKRLAESILERRAAEGVRWTALCPLEVYGARDPGSHLRLIYGRMTSGRYVRVGDGTNRSSICHVGNVIAAAMHVAEGPGEGPLLVADARAYTSDEIGRAMAEALGRRAPFLRVPRTAALVASWINARIPRPSGWPEPLSPAHVRHRTSDRLLDTSRAQARGIRAVFSLSDGVKEAVASWRSEVRRPDAPGAAHA